jgi:uncharacterized protein YacL
MTPSRTINLLRVLFVVFVTSIGTMIGPIVGLTPWEGAMAGLGFALAIVLVDRLLKGFTLRAFSSATFGLLLGFLFAQLLLASGVLHNSSENVVWLVTLVVYTTFGYLGMMLAMRSNRDEFSLIIPYVRFRQTDVQDSPLIIDTNIIIDGRAAALCRTGFLTGTFVVPSFVIEELQVLADSNDPQKRECGRRGLQNVQTMQLDPSLSVTIHEHPLEPGKSVDACIVQLAKTLGSRILSNDADLCKGAQLQNVVALNLNDLTTVLRPALSAGDRVELTLVKEGRDSHQAVGYLSDGTMIVVNHARHMIGETVRVAIAGTLQTTGGRMFFAELKNREAAGSPRDIRVSSRTEPAL